MYASEADDSSNRQRDQQPPFRALLGAAVLVLAGGTHAAGLFLPAGPADVAIGVMPATKSATAHPSEGAAPVAWERRVRIAHHKLAAARDDVEGARVGRLELDVKDGVRLDVVVERTAPTKWGYSLSGRIVGGEVGFVTLVVHEEAVAGSIWTPDSAYELSPLGGGLHTLQATNTRPFRCTTPSPFPVGGAINEGYPDGGSVVNILVVWTPLYLERLAGDDPEAQILLHVDMKIAFVNDALERSGALFTLNLVGAEQVDLDTPESNGLVLISQLIDPNDGHMDGVHDRRDALRADLVHMLTPIGARYGGPFSISPGIDHAVAHEIGHSLGVSHERFEYTVGSAGMSIGAYGFTTAGVRAQLPLAGTQGGEYEPVEYCEVTIMSYGRECYAAEIAQYTGIAANARPVALPYYASPWRYSPLTGRPLGVSRFANDRGVRGPADAVEAMNRRWARRR